MQTISPFRRGGLPRVALFAALLWCCTACDGGLLDKETRLNNTGSACITGGAIRVDFDRCLSSSCDELRDAQCTATLNGDVIEVTASAVVVSDGGMGACTADCGAARTTCALPQGSGGATALRYGGTSVALPASCPSF